ncbi:MAG: hypothetical protein JNJ70_21175 [Verrucomicrobiales bacterium]|nr:hypothetical protein [Verrucomicrobiales bacterium]
MRILSQHLRSLLATASLLTLAMPGLRAQQSATEKPKAEPVVIPIPAIPGVPAMNEPRRPAAVFPTAPGPGVAMPGFTLPGTTATSSKAERIRPEFQPGNTYRFVVKTELQLGGGEGFTMEQQARYDAKVRVDGKPGIVLKARTERLDLTFNSRGTTLTYESLKPEDQETPLGRHVRATMNRLVDLTLDDRGRIDASVTSGGGDETALLPDVPKFGPDELEQLIAGLFQGFSEKRVAPGDGWSLQGTRQIGEIGALTFDLSCRHAGSVSFEGQNCLSIEYAGTLAGSLPDAGAAPTTVEVQTTSLSGRVYLDPLDKMVRHAQQSIDLWITRPAVGEEPPVQTPVRQITTLRLLHVVPTA